MTTLYTIMYRENLFPPRRGSCTNQNAPAFRHERQEEIADRTRQAIHMMS